MHRVFVFGTLKRGFANHDPAMRGTRCLGDYRTVDAYPLLIAGRWFSPVMLPEPGTGHRVTGELYAVDDAKLAELDRVESTHLPDGYRRHAIAVECCATGAVTQAQVYMKERRLVQIVHSGYLERYDDDRYVPSARRGA
jgi:gamma-glutamylaminecyclotransferase